MEHSAPDSWVKREGPLLFAGAIPHNRGQGIAAQKFISYFTALDNAILEPLLAEAYHHQFAPAALNPPGPFDRAGFLAHLVRLKDIMSGFPVFAKEYIESQSTNQDVVWATSKAQFRDELKDDRIPESEWEFGGEYVFMFTMDEDGEKVVRCVESLDSLATKRLLELAARARVNLEKRKIASRYFFASTTRRTTWPLSVDSTVRTVPEAEVPARLSAAFFA
ncbi:hypothetical protein BDW67DRAFT_188388 [Aspergillus spinulosporus]